MRFVVNVTKITYNKTLLEWVRRLLRIYTCVSVGVHLLFLSSEQSPLWQHRKLSVCERRAAKKLSSGPKWNQILGHTPGLIVMLIGVAQIQKIWYYINNMRAAHIYTLSTHCWCGVCCAPRGILYSVQALISVLHRFFLFLHHSLYARAP